VYITYEQYQALGGTVSATDFPRFERRAGVWLDDWTLDRLRTMTEPYPDYVLVAMTEIIDALPKLGGERVTSFSNGVTSFSFDASKSDISMLYDDVMRILPLELVSRCVCG
jgi:hypothetical protein